MENFQYILPEIFISISIMLFLLVGVFKKYSANLIYNLSIISLVILLAIIIGGITIFAPPKNPVNKQNNA